MDFTSLPDVVFLKIFNLLPCEEQVRLGRVNKRFLWMSTVALSQTKVLNLDERFAPISPFQLECLLDICSGNLEKIHVSQIFDIDASLVLSIQKYSFKNLVELAVDYAFVGNDILDMILAKNSNLKRLSWGSWDFFQFPDMIHKKLEYLRCSLCNDSTYISLVDHVPNLKHFRSFTSSATEHALDKFFASVPNLETLDITFGDDIDFEKLTQLWNLNSVTSLKFVTGDGGRGQANDSFLRKVARSFPQLRLLHLNSELVTGRSIRSLAALSNLEEISLECDNDNDTDACFRQLRSCERLKHLEISNASLQPETFTTLVQCCRSLTFLRIRNITNIDTTEAAVQLIQSLCGPRNKGRDLVIQLDGQPIWTSAIVDQTLKKLEEEYGFRIKIQA